MSDLHVASHRHLNDGSAATLRQNRGLEISIVAMNNRGLHDDQSCSVPVATQTLTVRVPLAVRKQRGGRKLVLTPGGTIGRRPSFADTTLVKALARAFRWRRIMEAGRFAPIDDLATAENSTRLTSRACCASRCCPPTSSRRSWTVGSLTK